MHRYSSQYYISERDWLRLMVFYNVAVSPYGEEIVDRVASYSDVLLDT